MQCHAVKIFCKTVSLDPINILNSSSRFSLLYIHGWLSENFSGSKVAFRKTFRVTSGYLKDGTSSLEKVTGMIEAR
jgi:hypothetical protein